MKKVQFHPTNAITTILKRETRKQELYITEQSQVTMSFSKRMKSGYSLRTPSQLHNYSGILQGAILRQLNKYNINISKKSYLSLVENRVHYRQRSKEGTTKTFKNRNCLFGCGLITVTLKNIVWTEDVDSSFRQVMKICTQKN